MIICGCDEAGRGPLAGPVTAAAVILSEDFPSDLLADSKKLSPKKRQKSACALMAGTSLFSIGWVWPEEIDRINIHNASLLAMERALYGIPVDPDNIFVDGLFIPRTDCPCKAIVKGDTKIPEIQAASILAKVARDRWMVLYSRIDSRFEFEKHKGYPTLRHRELIHKYGLSSIHRKSFKSSYFPS